ncbi:hypothetical protein TWF730_006675 [Orbilia blumenaviensis]|uniref:Uncharacterized protein n=1 Tax=Orbilia blumenaviensis TaxID=1796055 RepID=A0AAV9VFC1_9PEZI
MHPATLISSFLLLAAPALSSTTYGCWSDMSIKFHKDCMIAATGLILAQTGNDDKSWIPPNIISRSWGGCTAKVRGSGSGNVVPAIALVSSFEQLGSRCQNGFFYYDSGYINAELNGHAGWKRDTSSTELQLETTWNTTESIPHYESGKPDWLSPHLPEEGQNGPSKGHKLAKRATGTFIGSEANRAGTFRLYRSATVIVGSHPGALVLVVEMYNVILDLIDAALTNTGSSILRAGLDATSGSTVNVLALAVQLSGGFNSWQTMFNSLGDSGQLVRDLIYIAVNDWSGAGLTAGVYHVYNRFDDVVFSFILNGVAGSLGPFPN